MPLSTIGQYIVQNPQCASPQLSDEAGEARWTMPTHKSREQRQSATLRRFGMGRAECANDGHRRLPRSSREQLRRCCTQQSNLAGSPDVKTQPDE
jgi:hypothetical protein